MSYLAAVLLLVGFFFISSGAVGIVRLPDFYTRLHAMGKCDTLGVALMVLGTTALVGKGSNGLDLLLIVLKLLLIILFVGLANPTATHALGRAAYRSGLVPWSEREKAAESEAEAEP